MKKLSFLLALSFSGIAAFATHIVGGEMSYQYLGGNDYHLTLKVYRDCINGEAPFDDPAYIFAFDANGMLVETWTVSLLQVDTVPLALSCGGIPPNICAEQGTYETDINLPPATGGYTLVYQRCCRSSIIGNLDNPLSQGMTISATIPDPSLATGNSSPVFYNYPPTAFCVGLPINFDHSAVDADGDSLVYEICSGVAGADEMNPLPVPPYPPPYANVVYLYPYSATYPFDASPALAIDASSGLITGTPSSIGIFTLGICVTEYRNGIAIGTHRREMAEVYTVFGLPVGTDDPSMNSKAVIYPVPVTNELQVLPASSDPITEIKIFDVAGKLLYHEQKDPTLEPFTVSLNGFKNGNYFLQLINGSSVQTQAFVVSK